MAEIPKIRICVQDEEVVFCCDAAGRVFLWQRLREAAAGDHAWFVGEELSGGEWDWVSVECRGVSKLEVEMASQGGQRALGIRCPANAVAELCRALERGDASAAECAMDENLQKFVLPTGGNRGILSAP